MKFTLARLACWAGALALAFAGVAIAGASAQSMPTFRGSGELFTIQVQVVGSRGVSLPNLGVEHFDVIMGGRQRVVRFAELVKVDGGWAKASAGAARVHPTDSWDDDSFFKPFPKRASAQYVLGIEVNQPDRDLAVRVKVSSRGLTVRRWMWRTILDNSKRFALTP